jgi:RNA polymerase sigma-70 factor (ECF subfamily)
VLWSKFDQYQPGSNFVSWACEISRLEVLNYLRKRKRTKTTFSADLQIELASLQSNVGEKESHAYQEALGDCLKKLPGDDQRLVRQCYGAGQSFKQVALSGGRTPKSVYDALGRIRRALLSCVKTTLAQQESL